MIWIAWGVGLLFAAAAAVLLLRRRPVAADRLFRLLILGGCLIAAVPALRVLMAPAGASAELVRRGPWAFGLDPLSSWFVLVIMAVGAATAAYGVPYLAPERGHRDVTASHALVAVLLVALLGVVIAQTAVAFLTAWEIMAVSAYLLILFEREDPQVRRAAFVYLILTHLSMLALLAMFASLPASAVGMTFAGLAQGKAALGPAVGSFLLFGLVGFGLKAGAVPLHFWLPGAHAAAPSHVSALFSGVMIKTGIYGLLRIIVLLGVPPAWFGWALLLLGLVSGILGVLWALAQHDLKRLLAYHSVENIGIILLGMGVGVLGLAYDHPAVAVLGFAGALLHTLNHALFKSLLFLGAGAVIRATGTRVIDRLGGVGRRMPLTALAFGIGAVAIVGLPPLNGFVSEWVIFIAMLRAGQSPDGMRLAAATAGGLALVGGLALACFTKVTGVILLGRERSADAERGADPGPGMTLPIWALAAACLVIGIFPGLVVGPAMAVARSLLPAGAATPDDIEFGVTALISLLAAGLVLLTASLFLLRRWRIRSSAPSRRDTWACGGLPDARVQYTASSYAAPLLTAFGPMTGLQATRTAAAFSTHAKDPVLDGAVRPVWRVVDRTGQGIRTLQSGRIRWYLLAVVFTLVGLLVLLATGATIP